MSRPQRSAYLGQYTDPLANRIAEQLHHAGIPWFYKQAGAIARVLFIGDWGTRLFVDASRLDEAREIARDVSAEAEAPTDPEASG